MLEDNIRRFEELVGQKLTTELLRQVLANPGAYATGQARDELEERCYLLYFYSVDTDLESDLSLDGFI